MSDCHWSSLRSNVLHSFSISFSASSRSRSIAEALEFVHERGCFCTFWSISAVTVLGWLLFLRCGSEVWLLLVDGYCSIGVLSGNFMVYIHSCASHSVMLYGTSDYFVRMGSVQSE